MTTSARDLLWLVFILIVVGVVWSMSGRGIGGLDFSSLSGGPRLSPGTKTQTPTGSQYLFGNKETIGIGENISQTQQQEQQISVSAAGAQNTDSQKEYVIIRNNGPENLNLSNLKLKNKNNEEASVGLDENGQQIILRAGEEALVLTGNTTKGVNFKINKCSGYFSQFYNFFPAIFPSCPNINNLPNADRLDDVCVEYLPQVRSCQTPTSLPTNLGSECQQFIQQHASYQGCVSDFKNDVDFNKGEWRVFLNRTSEFWSRRNEIIKLVDQSGKTIFEVKY